MEGRAIGEEEETRKIVKVKAILEKRLQEMETEAEGLRTLIAFIDNALLERGFKRATVNKPVHKPLLQQTRTAQTPVQREDAPTITQETTPLKTITGVLLANMFIQENSVRIVLPEERKFSVHTPPFTPFFVEMVLEKMREKDQKAMRAGEIPPEKIISYNITQEGELIREITIDNISPDRFRELKSTIRWTLEKMHEKMQHETQ